MDNFSLLFHTEITRRIVLNSLNDPGASECDLINGWWDRDLEDQVLVLHDVHHATECVIEVSNLFITFSSSPFVLRGL